MFNNINVTYDEKKEIYNVTGFFGLRFKKAVLMLLGKNKASAMFIEISPNNFKFYSFFLLEVYRTLESLTSSGSRYATDLRTLNKFLNYVDEYIWTDQNIKVHLDKDEIKNKMKFKILKHQEPAFDKYEIYKDKLGYRGLLFDMSAGSGKTFTSLAIAESLHSDRIIIVAPNQTIDRVWIHSLKEEVYLEPQKVHVVNRDITYNNERFLLVNYESLDKLDAFLLKHDFSNATVIVDESHNFANDISKRTKSLLNILNKIQTNNILMMSGTPIKAYSKELSVIMKILDTRFNSIIEKRFIKLYKTPTKLLKDILPERFGEYSVKVKKEELELEPVLTRYVSLKIKDGDKYTLKNIRTDLRLFIEKRSVELTNDFPKYKQKYDILYGKAKSLALLDGVNKKEFKTYETDFNTVIKLYKQNKLAFHPDVVKRVNMFENNILLPYLSGQDKKDFKEAKTVVKYLLLKLQGEALANVVMRARINCHKDIAANLSYSKIINSTVKKTIIFSNYVDVCASAEKKIYNEKLSPLSVYGKTSKMLSDTVTKFNTIPKYNPLITTYKSLSTGVPLIVANVVIAIDTPFRMYIYEQAIARVWRLGQDKQVVVYIPELDTGDEPNINGRNLDIITFYKEEVERITGHTLEIDISADDTISNEDYKYLVETNMYNPTVGKQSSYDILTKW